MVSIIIPFYNRINLISETLSSVLNQTHKDWEVILVDDHSTDGTFEFLQQFCENDKRFHIYSNLDGKKGASSARNIGLRYAAGDFVIFLDSDDLLAPHCLEQRVKIMKEQPAIDFAVFNQETFITGPTQNKRLFNQYPLDKGDDFLKMFFRNENPWSVTCPIWKKQALIHLKGFDEELIFMEDPDLHVRAIVNNFTFKVLEGIPADSFYRIAHMEGIKNQEYYKTAILSRILFLKKVANLSRTKDYMFFKKYKPSIKSGYIFLLRNLLLPNVQSFYHDFYLLNTWLKDNRVIDLLEYLKYLICGRVCYSRSWVIKAFKIKGLVYKLFL